MLLRQSHPFHAFLRNVHRTLAGSLVLLKKTAAYISGKEGGRCVWGGEKASLHKPFARKKRACFVGGWQNALQAQSNCHGAPMISLRCRMGKSCCPQGVTVSHWQPWEGPKHSASCSFHSKGLWSFVGMRMCPGDHLPRWVGALSQL